MTLTPPPRKPRNIDRRGREFLTKDEVELLLKAAKQHSSFPERDYALILLMFRHGLRVSEAVALTWDQVNIERETLFVRRLKRGRSNVQRLYPRELQALRRLKKRYPGFRHLFISQRLAPLTRSGVGQMIAQMGQAAGLAFPVHPHMLRHATGYHMVNRGIDTRHIQDHLGHTNITHTERYTALRESDHGDYFDD